MDRLLNEGEIRLHRLHIRKQIQLLMMRIKISIDYDYYEERVKLNSSPQSLQLLTCINIHITTYRHKQELMLLHFSSSSRKYSIFLDDL
jgi:hypothetical protein